METLFSHFSNRASTALTLNNETCQRARHLKVDDQCVLVSHSMTKNQLASAEFGQKTVIDKDEDCSSVPGRVLLAPSAMPVGAVRKQRKQRR